MCARTGDVLGLRQVYERLYEEGLGGTSECDATSVRNIIIESEEYAKKSLLCVGDIVQCRVLSGLLG